VKVRELIIMLSTLDQDKDIYAAIASDGGVMYVEEVTASCDDPEIIGYMITDEPPERETVN
jgi:hypothetical protein